MKDKTLYKKIMKDRGREKQFRKLQEECGELIAAINQFLDNRGKGVEHLYAEFADVEIEMECLRSNIKINKITQAKRSKLKKLRKKYGTFSGN